MADTSALVAESLHLTEVCRATQTASIEASEQLAKHLTEEQYRLVMKYVEELYSDHHDAFRDLLLAEMACHMPGLAPTLYLVFEHVMETRYDGFGRCCELES